MIACYCRVSTDDQNLDRQRQATSDYAKRHFDAELSDLLFYEDKSTGTDTDRSGYHDLLNDVESDNIEAVVVNSVTRLSRSFRDLDQTVDIVVDQNDVELHIVSEGLRMTGDKDPYQTAMLNLLAVFSEFEASIIQERVREGIRTRMQNDDYHHGPAPLGFSKQDGKLIEANEFDRVRTVISMVMADELSKRKAARELDTSRRTINRCLDRLELYNLS